MQLMPGTARAMGVNDSFDPQQNIMGGTRLLRVLANKYDGDMVKVLSAYHAGAGNVAKKGGIPFGATEGYVRAVLDHYYRYKSAVCLVFVVGGSATLGALLRLAPCNRASWRHWQKYRQ